MNDPVAGPASLAALREAIFRAHEPPAARVFSEWKSYRWLVVGTVCIGGFMGQVDASITQVVLPRLEAEFDAPLSAVTWVAVAYILAMGAFLPIFGRLADMLGRKLLYTFGFVLFVLGSALCGFAPNLGVLIAFRLLQGIGGAMLAANSVAIVVAIAGQEWRGRALGIQSAAQAIGLSAGPAIGGLLLETLDWRWVFWVNVPVGLAGAIAGWFLLPPSRDLPRGARFDWTGALLIAPALIALVAVLNEAHDWGVTSPLFLGVSLLAALLLILFVRAERRAADPLVDLTLFQRREISCGSIAGILAYAALFGVFFLMPFVLVRAYGDGIFAAGLRLTIVPVMLAVAAPIGGALSDKFSPRLPTAAGMLICAVASAMLYAVLDGTQDSLLPVMIALGIFGIGQGLFISPNNSAIVSAAPKNLTGEASGLLNVVRSVGVSAGVAAASSLLMWRLAELTGSGHNTLHASAPDLLTAAHAVIVMFGAFAAVGAALSLARSAESRPAKDAIA
jgi:EmrB/QacA subfamily drug resistance transporter